VRRDRAVELRPAHIRAFLCLAEARHLVRVLADRLGGDYLWPGFDVTRVPVIFYHDGSEAFLLQHPDPPDEFERVRIPIPGLEEAEFHYHRGPLPYLPAVREVEAGGLRTAALPLSFFSTVAPPEALTVGLVHDLFHVFAASLGLEAADLRVLSRYPELDPTNNALGTLEGLILHDFLTDTLRDFLTEAPGTGPAPGGGVEPERTAYEFCLVRRERRGPLEDEVIDYEQQLEAREGLARYVEVKALIGAGSPEYEPSRAFRTLSGRDTYSLAPELVGNRLARLREINVKAAGAAWWRFFETGMALGLFADHIEPKWKSEVARGATLDSVVERGVRFLGDPGDERELDRLKEKYDYESRLETEWAFSLDERRRRDGLLARLLGAEGTRFTFDVSDLIPEETWWDSGRFTMVWDPSAVDTVSQNVRIHKRGLRFKGFGTDLRFKDLPVVEDLKHRLFHVSVPVKGALNLEGDGHPFSLGLGAQFEDGLEVRLPGVHARARSGYVKNLGETLYIKITR